VIVPTGPLSYVPFQVLTTSAGTPLIDRFEISYLPNAGSMEFLGREREPPGTLFVGALGGLSVEGLDPLPGTLAEARAIAEIQPGARLATEHSFTRSVVLEALQRDAAVHLATHSVLHPDAPMFSAILTAPDDERGARISLYEIMDLDLAARLVVLSACETGLGRLGRGDEITGLTRTFLIAGAGTVVSSLWEVSDDATIFLMRVFYEELREGQSPARALRRAALAVRERHPHPMNWAPFIVTGAPPRAE
jgi:CHAT domain-containing protein